MIVPPALPSGGYAEQLEQTNGDFLRLLLETANMRVPRVIHITGYSLFSFTRAVAVVNFQSALACFLLRLFSQAVTSATRVCLSEIRRSRH